MSGLVNLLKLLAGRPAWIIGGLRAIVNGVTGLTKFFKGRPK